MGAVYLGVLPRLVFDGVEDMVVRCPKWNEVSLCFTFLTRFECTLGSLVNRGRVVAQILPLGELWLWLLDLGSLCLFNLHVLLCSDKDVPHLSNIVLHHILVERVGDLQPTDKRCGGNVFVEIVHQHQLALEVADVIFQALPWFHFHCEEMVIILLKLPSNRELVVKGISYIFKGSERVL